MGVVEKKFGLLAVSEQLAEEVRVLLIVAEKVTQVPGGPRSGRKTRLDTKDRSVDAALTGVGIATEDSEMKTDESSNITTYVELTLRVFNLEHAVVIR